MADYDLDGSELLALAAELDEAGRTVADKVEPIVKDYAYKLRNEWRDNARFTARRHGVHYPSSITAEQIPAVGAVEWEVGPDGDLPQGGMGRGFEFGSVNQPPHLDGAYAVVKIEPEFNAAIDKAVRDLL